MNTFPGLVHTAPSHHGSWICPEVSDLTAREGAAEGGADDWGGSRNKGSRIGKVRLDHLLSKERKRSRDCFIVEY